MHRATLWAIACLILTLACGPSAAPAAALAGGGARRGERASGGAAAASAPAPERHDPAAGDRRARAEGQVNATLQTSWTPGGHRGWKSRSSASTACASR